MDIIILWLIIIIIMTNNNIMIELNTNNINNLFLTIT